MYDDSPHIVIWEMTRACALACQHCRAKAIPRRNDAELTTAEAFNLVDQVAGFGHPIFILTGGDPFMRPDVFEIVEYAAKRELRIAVSPSGTGRLTKATLERLAAAGCRRMSLSIDGWDVASHDAFRGVKGTFERTLGAARQAREAGIELQINTTIARHNKSHIKEIAALVEQIDAQVWTAFFLIPTGRAKLEDCLDAAGFEAAFADLFNVLANGAVHGKDDGGPALPPLRDAAPREAGARQTAALRGTPSFPGDRRRQRVRLHLAHR